MPGDKKISQAHSPSLAIPSDLGSHRRAAGAREGVEPLLPNKGLPPPRVRASSSLLINPELGARPAVEQGGRRRLWPPVCSPSWHRNTCLQIQALLFARRVVLASTDLPAVLCCAAGMGRRVPANPGLVPGTPHTGLLPLFFRWCSLPFPAGLEVLAIVEPTSAHTDVTA